MLQLIRNRSAPPFSLESKTSVHDVVEMIVGTMDRISLRQPLRLRAIAILCLLWSFIGPAQGLYFYLESTEPKCFYEDLPKDTLVVGASTSSPRPRPLGGDAA